MTGKLYTAMYMSTRICCGWIIFWRIMKLSVQEIDALMTALQLMNLRDKNRQEQFLGVDYAEIYKKLENYRFNLTSF